MNEAQEAAEWMTEAVRRAGVLEHEYAATEIERLFGPDVVYGDDSVDVRIAKPVLVEFRKRTPDFVWQRGDKCWRRREPDDDTGRQAD